MQNAISGHVTEEELRAAQARDQANLVPMVIEKTAAGERGMDIFSRLMRERQIFINGPIHDGTAAVVCAQLKLLEAEAVAEGNPNKPIILHINSPGGSVMAGLAIYDTMQFISCPVYTVCSGLAASMGSVLLAAGAPGHRYIRPNAHVMIHQPLSGTSGQVSDQEISVQFSKKLKEDLYRIYTHHTGIPREEIWELCERDNWLSAEDAVALGMVDQVDAVRFDASGNPTHDLPEATTPPRPAGVDKILARVRGRHKAPDTPASLG